eukprot:NODE_498_length_2173_cov_21.769774_g458_i0.p1 GENE.NODE_498_length_2173_cov_21.769774_g458_i0~~NODE_498_length_2173_cov_21.769774_g458_i0.p1  ORF type:complete len:603 (+),score=106.31 NODE_498_length_2173_cov_21.769774_g458_i0:93-1901(+)
MESAPKRQRTSPVALLSVSCKSGLDELVRGLHRLHVDLIASGGTGSAIRKLNIPVKDVAEITKAPEMLGGRVKTLHPAVHGGVLARESSVDTTEMLERGYDFIDFVFCNLYPFQDLLKKKGDTVAPAEAIEEIDIGGVALLRAAAKNHARVVVVCDPADYPRVLQEMEARQGKSVSLELRNELALKAFTHTAQYDSAISGYFRKIYGKDSSWLSLRYGMNSHQSPASVFCTSSPLPFKVLNGAPGYINLLDALNSWTLVKDLQRGLGAPAAASFKHVSPAGAAVALVEMTEEEKRVCFVEDMDLSPIATAYARARGADRMSSFGDFIALSEPCDEVCAKIIEREVSDGIIAPSYHPKALETLSKKKGGKYCILEMNPDFIPEETETRQVFGITLQQPRNGVHLDTSILDNVVSKNKDLPDEAKRDLLVATITLKSTQSNSVCFAHRGQVIGLGAGQQSRVHCTRIAASKAECWRLRHHPRVLGMQWKKGVRRATKSNAIDLYVSGEIENATETERSEWAALFDSIPTLLTGAERSEFLLRDPSLALGSDAFFPFADNIHRAHRTGVKYVAAPGGSQQDAQVLATADLYDMVMCHTTTRLFHH